MGREVGGSSPSVLHLLENRSMAGRRFLGPPMWVRLLLLQPREGRTVASTPECHSGHTGSTPVLRSKLCWIGLVL